MSRASRARSNRSRHRKIVALARAVHFDAHGECSDDQCSVYDNMLFHVDMALTDVFRQTRALRRTLAAPWGGVDLSGLSISECGKGLDGITSASSTDKRRAE